MSVINRLYDLLLSILRPCDFREDLPRQGSNGTSKKKHVVPEEEPEPPPPPEENVLYKGISDGAIWNCALGKHKHGEFSYAVIQANTMMEDFSRVECSSAGTFVGVFDGHGGHAASDYLSDNMHHIIRDVADASGGLSSESLARAFEEADTRLLQVVRENWKIHPNFATAGSCALVGVVEGATLFLASVGDSRAVLATAGEGEGKGGRLTAVPISKEHSACIEECRREVLERCPDDPSILKEKGGMWRVKGIIQVTRSIGDFYLKHQEFQCPPLYTKYRLPEELKAPALVCTPSVTSRALSPSDKFIIFASDGLWDYVSSEEAVDLVQAYPRQGIARRLVKLAVIRASKKRKLAYSNVRQMRPGRRREIHDDTTVVVLFLDHVGTPRPRELEPASVKSMQELPEYPAPAQGEDAGALCDARLVEEEVDDEFQFGNPSGPQVPKEEDVQ